MPVDRTRKFELPGIQDLNKDQDVALAMPLRGQHLIIGGPGTGKSVVALLRARRLAQEQYRYRILVYNHLLEGSNRHLFGGNPSLTSKTWDKWFRDLYRHIFRSSAPTLDSKVAGGYRPVDWEAIEHRSDNADLKPALNESYFLVVDEGQDMPPVFYKTLVNWGLENFYVVADQNQQIYPNQCSSRQDLENVLGVETKDTLELRANYRNTQPIALLAQHFYPADPASPKPDLPIFRPALTPELWIYDEPGAPSFSEIIARILTLSDRNPRKLIGIITPNHKVREKYLFELEAISIKLDNGKPPIQTYTSSNSVELAFGQGGIMVISAQSCKGLEFDTVILADIDQHAPKHALHTLKSRFYVMITRARDQVMLLRTGTVCPVVEGLLPIEANILIRK